MENVRRKKRMIETYSVLFTDIVSVSIAYALAIFIRFYIIFYYYTRKIFICQIELNKAFSKVVAPFSNKSSTCSHISLINFAVLTT